MRGRPAEVAEFVRLDKCKSLPASRPLPGQFDHAILSDVRAAPVSTEPTPTPDVPLS